MEKTFKKEQVSSQLELIEKLIHSIQYGTITIIIQDGKIVQIDKSEKYRI
ncbi:MAG: YezD family protein [Lachnospiraceae bacterium]|nr:YezD family protein [Lachnospiraceae bacterium]